MDVDLEPLGVVTHCVMCFKKSSRVALWLTRVETKCVWVIGSSSLLEGINEVGRGEKVNKLRVKTAT